MDKASMRGGAPIVRQGAPDSEGVEVFDVPAEPEPSGSDPIEVAIDGSVTIHLSHAFRPPTKGPDIAAGITKIVLREMTAGDMVDMDKGESDTGKLLHLAASLSGMPVTVLERLHFEDFAILHAVCNEKLGKFLRASAKVSSLLFAR